MNRVFVLSSTKKPLMPCHSQRARELLSKGKAAVYRYNPFTIILKDREDGDTQPIEWKIDPGSRETGMVLVGDFPKQGKVVLFAAHLVHRGILIVDLLLSRRRLRSVRRNRKTRYREPRFNNRIRTPGWLQPSFKSRVDNIITWCKKFMDRAPIVEIQVESVKFDTQLLNNPDISGKEYQQGTLFGYELKEYLLEKYERTCVYCGAKGYPVKNKKGVPLEIEHITPKSRGGSNRLSNLTIACTDCNHKKDNKTAKEFGFPDIQNNVTASLRDAAAVNSTRKSLRERLKDIGLPIDFWTGGRTKFNRLNQGYDKAHWIDAACVGESGSKVNLNGITPLIIKAMGRGKHQVVRTDKDGFPNSSPGRCKRVFGFQTGDFVKLDQPKGKYKGIHFGRLSGVGLNGKLNLKTKIHKQISTKNHIDRYKLLQRGDGYAYSY